MEELKKLELEQEKAELEFAQAIHDLETAKQRHEVCRINYMFKRRDYLAAKVGLRSQESK